MFGRFTKKRDPNKCPVSEERRQWIEASFLWLLHTFDKKKIIEQKILVPHFSDFPIQFDGSAKAAFDTLTIVANQMEVAVDGIHLEIYTQGVNKLDSGSYSGNGIFLGTEKDDKTAAGLYWGRNESDNKFHIWLKDNVLAEPESVVATLAHEIAHIKLLGEKRLNENDEHLTDLTTIIFGLGIFNANRF